MKYNILLFLSLLAQICNAQNPHCATQMGQSQVNELKAFQQQLANGSVSLEKKGIQYVPLKIHIVGNSKGVGYFHINSLMQTLCDINEDYIPTGFHFYLADSIDYINDDDLYRGSSDAIWNRAESYKMQGAVNVFFHGDGVQWCGVYFSGIDVVFIKNSCQGTNATTLTHELGHFFSLPHTFSGWENNNTPGNIENVSESNCRTAGDGFCDTRPDYISERWSCPLSYNLIDPEHVAFKPDSSIYMSYSLDVCQSRFSNEQMAAMRNNLSNRMIAKGNENTTALASPQLLLPTNADSNQNAAHVVLKWHSVPGAFAYHVQVARFGLWEYLNFDKLLFDTTAIIELFGAWPYKWRVKAITSAYTCTPFGLANTFKTYEMPAGFSEIKLVNDQLNIYPNPLILGQLCRINAPEKSLLQIFNSLGQLVIEQTVNDKTPQIFAIDQSGMYVLQITSKGFCNRQKIIVQ